MRVAILNLIMTTPVEGAIVPRASNQDTVIYNMARGFVSGGHRVTLLTSEEYRPTEAENLEFDVIYFPSVLKKIFKPTLLPYPTGLKKYLKKHSSDFDMLISVEAFSIASLIAARVAPKKLLIWQEMAKFQRLFFKIPAKIWYGIVVRTFLRDIPVVGMSQPAQSFAGQFMRNVSDRVVSHGVDESVFYPSERHSGYFIVVSSLVRLKRVDCIIQEYAQFVSSCGFYNVGLKIVGDGPEKDNLKKLAQESGCSDRIEFMGKRDHAVLSKILRDAVGLLVYTEKDLNMVSITEALVSGCPVLMNKVPLIRDRVEKYNLGIVKDDWGCEEMKMMIEKYDELHGNCIKERWRFTSKNVADTLCDIFLNQKALYKV